MKNITRILSAAMLVCGILLAAGVLYVFHACGPMDDGTWMKCHWAQQVSAGLGIVLAVQGLLSTLARTNAARAGISAAAIPTAILAILIPNTIIPLCMMSDMRCQAIMRPAVYLVAGITLILAIANTILSSKNND